MRTKSTLGILLLASASAWSFVEIEDADYHVSKGYRACIACHVYRGKPGVDAIVSCNDTLLFDINFRNFPSTAPAGQTLQAVIDFVRLGTQQEPNVILVEPNTRVNIKDFGWSIVRDPKGTQFNYVFEDFKDPAVSDFTMTYQLGAPRKPGRYEVEAGIHGSGCFQPFNNIYIREDVAVIDVTPVAESTSPRIQQAAALYAKQVAVRFSEPVQTAGAANPANYLLTKNSDENTNNSESRFQRFTRGRVRHGRQQLRSASAARPFSMVGAHHR